MCPGANKLPLPIGHCLIVMIRYHDKGSSYEKWQLVGGLIIISEAYSIILMEGSMAVLITLKELLRATS